MSSGADRLVSEQEIDQIHTQTVAMKTGVFSAGWRVTLCNRYVIIWGCGQVCKRSQAVPFLRRKTSFSSPLMMYPELPQQSSVMMSMLFSVARQAAYSTVVSLTKTCCVIKEALPVTMQIPRGPAASGFTVTEWSRSRRAEQG